MPLFASRLLTSVVSHTKGVRRDRRRFATSLENLEARVVMTTYPTTTAMVESLTSGALGTSVTFTATVSSTNGVPAGSVVFQDGSVSLGSATLSGGVASISTNSLALGARHRPRCLRRSGNVLRERVVGGRAVKHDQHGRGRWYGGLFGQRRPGDLGRALQSPCRCV